jgi:predicted transcriptional regulator
MFVRNWMSAPAVVIPPAAAAGATLGFMEKRGIRRLPVVEDGRLVGIVTKSDLQAAPGSGPAREIPVADVMTRSPLTADPDETLEEATKKMLDRKVSGLPVVDGGAVVGIITESDLFRALASMLGIGEKGARVVMTVKDDADLLGSVGRRLNGLAVRSLVTVHDPARGVWDVVLRARGRKAKRA